VLLADEPAASLDIRHRLDVVRALAERGRDRLSVVVMHDLDLALRFFERVILLDRGHIEVDCSASELAADQNLDRVFGVTFSRYRTEFGPALHAR
jgi:iron complex transport system ATP-binding protein